MTEPAGKSSPSPPTPAASPSASPPQISIEDVQRLALRIGIVVAAETHPNADRLLVLKVDLGDGAPPRQLVAGIKASYQPAELVGKRVVVVVNLKPAMLRGVESQGMVLVASDASGIALLTPERPVQPGSLVK